MASSVRGAYRSVYSRIWDDPDFIALGRDGQHLFFVLKHELGPSGIRTANYGDLEARFLARDPTELARYIELLRNHRWIVFDQLAPRRFLIWLRNGLHYEPSFGVGNPNHAKKVLDVVRPLPKHPIVGAFMDHYTAEVAPQMRAAWTRLRSTFPEGSDPDQLMLKFSTIRAQPMQTPLDVQTVQSVQGASRAGLGNGIPDPIAMPSGITRDLETRDKDPVLLEPSGIRQPAGRKVHDGEISRAIPSSRILDAELDPDDPRRPKILLTIGGLHPGKPGWIDELLQDLAHVHDGISLLANLVEDMRHDRTRKARDDWIRVVQTELGALPRKRSRRSRA